MDKYTMTFKDGTSVDLDYQQHPSSIASALATKYADTKEQEDEIKILCRALYQLGKIKGKDSLINELFFGDGE